MNKLLKKAYTFITPSPCSLGWPISMVAMSVSVLDISGYITSMEFRGDDGHNIKKCPSNCLNEETAEQRKGIWHHVTLNRCQFCVRDDGMYISR